MLLQSIIGIFQHMFFPLYSSNTMESYFLSFNTSLAQTVNLFERHCNLHRNTSDIPFFNGYINFLKVLQMQQLFSLLCFLAILELPCCYMIAQKSSLIFYFWYSDSRIYEGWRGWICFSCYVKVRNKTSFFSFFLLPTLNLKFQF